MGPKGLTVIALSGIPDPFPRTDDRFCTVEPVGPPQRNVPLVLQGGDPLVVLVCSGEESRKCQS